MCTRFALSRDVAFLLSAPPHRSKTLAPPPTGLSRVTDLGGETCILLSIQIHQSCGRSGLGCNCSCPVKKTQAVFHAQYAYVAWAQHLGSKTCSNDVKLCWEHEQSEACSRSQTLSACLDVAFFVCLISSAPRAPLSVYHNYAHMRQKEVALTNRHDH